MITARTVLANILGKTGYWIFGLLTMWEEKGSMPGTLNWFKVGILGFVASAVVSLTLHAEEPKILCYIVARMPVAEITEVNLKPNPTFGADSISVSARAKVIDSSIEGNYISDAYLSLGNDTTRIQILAKDGKFSDTLETLEGRIYVGNLDPCTTGIYIVVTTSMEEIENTYTELIVSEPDSTVKEDSNE